MGNGKREGDEAPVKVAAVPADATAEPRRRRPRVTPMPMNQMIPMTFVLLNESLCMTMLLPFVGLFVSHLKNTSVEEAGYESGMLIGVFMLGQMVSAKLWGWLSDNYGRRFPLISGLFTSGVMMLGFGLSSSVWMCAVFRFFHGLFNGNVLVAKTMMADITDKTNQAKGFAFVSLCYGIGVLIGPTLGGLLYDPANSSALSWAHFSKDGFFSRHPAFLPSLVIFGYTNVGMLVCTFFVMESNPHAKPLPRILKIIYPCFWREPEMFVHPPLPEDRSDDQVVAHSSDNDEEEEDEDRLGMSIHKAGKLVANASMSHGVAPMMIASPVRHEDARFDHLVAAENLTTATRRKVAVTPRYGQSTLPKMMQEELASRSTTTTTSSSDSAVRDDKEEARVASAVPSSSTGTDSAASAAAKKTRKKSTDALAEVEEEQEEDGLIVVETNNAEPASGAVVPAGADAGEAVVLKRFGFKQAFEIPVTRTMLVVYMLLSAADMTIQEILPLWAIAKISVGGLGFGADKVGYIILTNSFPCVASNLLFHGACARYENKLTLFRLSVLCCSVSVCVLPFISFLDLGGYLFFVVVLCTSVRQFFSSWCYSIVTMLTARSAPAGHVGSIMGINQSCNALVRTIVPFIVTPLFAWSITSGNPFPFDHVFVFLLSSTVFMTCYVYSEFLRTDADVHLEMIEELPLWMEKTKALSKSCLSNVCGRKQDDADDAPRRQ